MRVDQAGAGCYSAAMPLQIAARADTIAPFLAMEVLERALALERAGRTIVHLEVGEPDFPPPPAAIDACTRALADGETGYTDSRGLLALREAIAADHLARCGVSIDPERILVTSGTSPAMLLVFALLIESGDEVVIGTPHYPCYPNFVRLFGGVPVFVPTSAADGWRLDPLRVQRAIGPRTRAIVIGSPANPTGGVRTQRRSASWRTSAFRSSATRSTTASSTTTRKAHPPSGVATTSSCSTDSRSVMR